MSGSGPIYEYQRELTAKLEQVMRERDEARAEMARLKADSLKMGDYWSFAAALRDVAERQREACAAAVDAHGIRSEWGAVVRATPLVTEGEPASRVSQIDRETGTITFDDGPIIEARPRRRRK